MCCLCSRRCSANCGRRTGVRVCRTGLSGHASKTQGNRAGLSPTFPDEQAASARGFAECSVDYRRAEERFQLQGDCSWAWVADVMSWTKQAFGPWCRRGSAWWTERMRRPPGTGTDYGFDICADLPLVAAACHSVWCDRGRATHRTGDGAMRGTRHHLGIGAGLPRCHRRIARAGHGARLPHDKSFPDRVRRAHCSRQRYGALHLPQHKRATGDQLRRFRQRRLGHGGQDRPEPAQGFCCHQPHRHGAGTRWRYRAGEREESRYLDGHHRHSRPRHKRGGLAAVLPDRHGHVAGHGTLLHPLPGL